MIGIAAIVALVGGANNYIDAMEEASIATDPIVIARSGLDVTGLLSSENLKNIVAQSTADQEASHSSDTL